MMSKLKTRYSKGVKKLARKFHSKPKSLERTHPEALHVKISAGGRGDVRRQVTLTKRGLFYLRKK